MTTSDQQPDQPAGSVAQTPAESISASELIAQLPSGVKVKRRVFRMRGCDETNAKGKPCHGHLKRAFLLDEEFLKKFGKVEAYRCERCHTLYLPHDSEVPRTRVLSW